MDIFFFSNPLKESKLSYAAFQNKKTHLFRWVLLLLSGERGIRTPGPVTVNSFQDCRIRPLCHFSAAKVMFFLVYKKFPKKYFVPLKYNFEKHLEYR
jgi:hypothetical protein